MKELPKREFNLNDKGFFFLSNSFRIHEGVVIGFWINSTDEGEQYYYQLQYEFEREAVLKKLDSFYTTFAYAAKRKFEIGDTNYLEKITAQAKQKQLQTLHRQSQQDVERAMILLKEAVQSDKEFKVAKIPLNKLELNEPEFEENPGLIYFSKLFDKWLCFPFLAQLFVPKNYLPKNREYKSTIDLAVDMVKYLKENVKQTVILVADGYFAKRKLLKTCYELKITLISRLQSNAALFLPFVRKSTNKRGRPRKYGKRLASLATLAKSKKGFNDLTLKLYGKKRQIRVKRIDAIWKPAGQIVQVLIIFYENKKKPAFFFCTDLSFSVEAILTRIAARWSLENIFKDLKEHLGWSHWQCRVEKAVSRSATLTCSTASLLVLWSLEEASQKQPEFWDTVPWYTHKATPSMKDMIEQLRYRILDLSFNAINRNCKTIAKKERAYRQILKLAA